MLNLINNIIQKNFNDISNLTFIKIREENEYYILSGYIHWNHIVDDTGKIYPFFELKIPKNYNEKEIENFILKYKINIKKTLFHHYLDSKYKFSITVIKPFYNKIDEFYKEVDWDELEACGTIYSSPEAGQS